MEGYNHVCRSKGCGYKVRKRHGMPEPCPRCGMLLKAGVPVATVQRILRHSDPAITTEVYGHLDVEDMRKGLNPLNFHPPHGAATE